MLSRSFKHYISYTFSLLPTIKGRRNSSYATGSINYPEIHPETPQVVSSSFNETAPSPEWVSNEVDSPGLITKGEEPAIIDQASDISEWVVGETIYLHSETKETLLITKYSQ